MNWHKGFTHHSNGHDIYLYIQRPTRRMSATGHVPARVAPDHDFNVARLEDGRFPSGVGKINSVQGKSSGVQTHDPPSTYSPTRHISPMPPFFNVVGGKACRCKKHCLFFQPRPLDFHLDPTLTLGDRVGRAEQVYSARC